MNRAFDLREEGILRQIVLCKIILGGKQ